MISDKLKNAVIQAAIQGKLTKQFEADDKVDELLSIIKSAKKLSVELNSCRDYSIKNTHNTDILFDLPKNWRWTKLGDLAFILNGDRGKNYPGKQYWIDSGVPFINAGCLQGKYLNDSFFNYISEDRYNLLRSGFIEKNDILYCLRGSLGKTAINSDFDKGAIASSLCIIRPILDECTEYIYLVLNSPFGKTLILDVNTGTAQPNLSANNLRNYSIPLPPLAEQKRIVEKLDQILPMIDALEKDEIQLDDIMIKFPDNMKESILFDAIQGKLTNSHPEDSNLNEIFEDKHRLENREIPFDIPNNWVWTTLNYAGIWKAGATPLRSNNSYYSKGNIPWLKTGDLNNSYIDDIPESITEKAVKETSVKLQPKGTVLIAMYGATIGKLGILNLAATTNQACCGCVTNDMVYNKYLFYYLMAYKKTLIKKGAGGAQPNISRTKIVNTEFALPPLEEQKRIVDKLDKLMPTIHSLRTRVKL